MARNIKQRVFRIKPQTTMAACPSFDSEPDIEIIRASLPGHMYHADKTLLSDVVIPTKLVQNYGTRKFPQILSNSAGWMYVSASVRAIIEELEGDVHQFTPEVKVFYKDGRPSEERYYGLAWGEDLNGTIIVEKSAWRDKISRTFPMEKGAAVPFQRGALTGSLAIDRAVIAGRHIWRAPDYSSTDDWYGSGELVAAFKKLKVRGLYYYEQVVEDR